MIECKNLTLHFDDKLVLSNLSLNMPESGVVCFTGPSGCGKTTLLRVLAGLQKPENGTVTGLEGKRCGVLFQENRLLEHLTVEQNTGLVLSDSQTELPMEILKRLQMEEEAKTYPSELSGGMRRRVAIGRALAYDGDVLMMDEPFQGIDLKLKRIAMLEILKQYENRLVIMITHDRSEAAWMADEVYLMDGPPLRVEATEKFDMPAGERDIETLAEYFTRLEK